jgi:hypothetical protein
MTRRRHTSSTLRHAALIGSFVLSAAACGGSSEALTPAELLPQGMTALLDSLVVDEYRAGARYQQVMQAFGSVSPFREMEPVQAARVEALMQIYRKYPAFPPPDPFEGPQYMERYASLAGACEVAAEAETATADRYARALALNPPQAVQKILRYNRASTLAFEVAAASRCR